MTTIVSILVNLTILFIVIFAFEELSTRKNEYEEEFDTYYAGRYNHTNGAYGTYPLPNYGYGGGYPAYNGRIPIPQNYPDVPYFNHNLNSAYYANSTGA